MITRTTTYLRTSPKGTVFQVTKTFVVNERADIEARKRRNRVAVWATNTAANVRYVESHVAEDNSLDPKELKSIMEAYEEYQEALKY